MTRGLVAGVLQGWDTGTQYDFSVRDRPMLNPIRINSALSRRQLFHAAAAALGTWVLPSKVQAAVAHTPTHDQPQEIGPYPPEWLPDGVRSRFVHGINGLRLHVLEAGFESPGRPAVLLLHGFPELAYSWRSVMVPLAEAGYHVIAPDQRGYGRTTGWDDDYDGDYGCNCGDDDRHCQAQSVYVGHPSVDALVRSPVPKCNRLRWSKGRIMSDYVPSPQELSQWQACHDKLCGECDELVFETRLRIMRRRVMRCDPPPNGQHSDYERRAV